MKKAELVRHRVSPPLVKIHRPILPPHSHRRVIHRLGVQPDTLRLQRQVKCSRLKGATAQIKLSSVKPKSAETSPHKQKRLKVTWYFCGFYVRARSFDCLRASLGSVYKIRFRQITVPVIIILAEGFVGVIDALRPSCWPSYFEAVVPGGRAGVMVKCMVGLSGFRSGARKFVIKRVDKGSFTTVFVTLTLESPDTCFQKSRKFSGPFRLPQIPLYLRNAEVLSHQTSQSSNTKNMFKAQFFKTRRLQFYKWLVGPKTLPGIS